MDRQYKLVFTTDAEPDEVDSWALGVMSRNTPPGDVSVWTIVHEDDES